MILQKLLDKKSNVEQCVSLIKNNTKINKFIESLEDKKTQVIDILDNFVKKIESSPEKLENHKMELREEISKISIKIISLVSGGGTTMDYTINEMEKGNMGLIEVVGVIASKNGIGAIKKVQLHKIHTVILNKYHSKDPETLNALAELFSADIIIGNGWLPLIPKEVIEKFKGIILNQHPGPLRENHLDFGGKGMYGTRVTAARVIYLLESGLTGDDLFTESTVHIMTENFDEGYSVGVKKLDIQKEIEKYKKDLPESKNKEELFKELISDIQEKLIKLEHKNVSETIKEVSKLKKGESPKKHPSYSTILVPEENRKILEKAKQKAIELFPEG